MYASTLSPHDAWYAASRFVRSLSRRSRSVTMCYFPENGIDVSNCATNPLSTRDTDTHVAEDVREDTSSAWCACLNLGDLCCLSERAKGRKAPRFVVALPKCVSRLLARLLTRCVTVYKLYVLDCRDPVTFSFSSTPEHRGS